MKLVLSFLAAPLLAQQGVNFYTLEKERALGQQLASEIRRESKPLGVPSADAYVKRIGGELVAQLKNASFDYQFEVISSATWTEPFSLPGGYVFVPARALLAARDESGFAGMLAHAIGHAALRHGTRMATQGQVANLASIPLVFVGTWTGAHADSRHSPTMMPVGFMKLQRTYELEADRFGTELAARTGYDRAARPSSEEFLRVQEAVGTIIQQLEQKRPPTLKR